MDVLYLYNPDKPLFLRKLNEQFKLQWLSEFSDFAESALYEEFDLFLLDGSNLMISQIIAFVKKLRSKEILGAFMVVVPKAYQKYVPALLMSGVDEVVLCDCCPNEFVARTKSLLRRTCSLAFDENLLTVNDLSLNTVSGQAIRKGQLIHLRRKEFELLMFLMKNAGRALSRSKIFEYVWGFGCDSGVNTVDVHIKYLRDKIDKPFPWPLVHTVYGCGYVLKNAGPDISTAKREIK